MSRATPDGLDSPENGSTFLEILKKAYPEHGTRIDAYSASYPPGDAIDCSLEYIRGQLSKEEMTDERALRRIASIQTEPSTDQNYATPSDKIDNFLAGVDESVVDAFRRTNPKIVYGIGGIAGLVCAYEGLMTIHRLEYYPVDTTTLLGGLATGLCGWVATRAHKAMKKY